MLQDATTTDKSFLIDYMHQVLPSSVFRCFEQRRVRVRMYRYPADKRLGETEDSFRCHLADTDEPIGACQDTKDDAVGEARYVLMDRSRDWFAMKWFFDGCLSGG